ncbi:MAG: hypothetical protein HYX43_15375 [Burkholderiales bacterium]|nr:hypothetical protein [Burkholderiales bacterium]
MSKAFSIQKADLLSATEPVSSNLKISTSLLGFQFDPTISLGSWERLPGKTNLTMLVMRKSTTKVSLDGVESQNGFLLWSFEKDSSNKVVIGNLPQLVWAFPTSTGSCIQAKSFTFWPKDEVSVPGFQRTTLAPDEIPRVNFFEFRPTSKRDTYVSANLSLNSCLANIQIRMHPTDLSR